MVIADTYLLTGSPAGTTQGDAMLQHRGPAHPSSLKLQRAMGGLLVQDLC